MKRRLLFAVTAAAFAAASLHLSASDALAQQQKLPGSGKTVSPARPNWDSFWFGQRIVDIGMEQLGYKVEAPKTLAPTAIFASLANGDLHYTADTILPNHSEMYAKTANDVIAVGPLMDPGTMQGYMVDKKTAEAHNIRYLEDFANPKIAAFPDANLIEDLTSKPRRTPQRRLEQIVQLDEVQAAAVLKQWIHQDKAA